jgi:hypothetical protein
VEGIGPRRFDLVLHPEPPFELAGPEAPAPGTGGSTRLILAGRAPHDRLSPTAGDGAAAVSVFSDGPFAASLRDGYTMTVPREYVRFDAAAPADRRAFLTVCGWDGADPRVVEYAPGRWGFDREDADGRLAVRLGGAEDGPVATDARLAAVLRAPDAGGTLHAIVMGGTRLDAGGRPLLRAPGAVHAAVETGPPLRAHVWAAAGGTMKLSAAPAIHRVFVDGVRVEAVRDGDLLAFPLTAGEHRIEAAEGGAPPPPRTWRFPAGDLPAAPLPDAPAFREGVRARASSTWTSPLDAIDGDPNTFWASLPGLPMPQWIEVELPAADRVGRVLVRGELPCAGHVETWDAAAGAWIDRGGFELTPDRPDAAAAFAPADVLRLRVRVDRIDPPNTAATLTSLRWDAGAERE